MLTRRLLTAVLLGWCAGSFGHSDTLTIASGEFPPWTGEHLPNGGYVNHLVAAAFEAVDIDVEFVYLPWARAFRETAQGNFHATTYWYESPERRALMHYSEPLVTNRTVFFQRQSADPISWAEIDDLAGSSIAAIIGYTYTPEFHRAINNRTLNATLVPNDYQGLSMLASGRVDLFVSDELTGWRLANNLSIDPDDLRVLEPALVEVTGHMLAPKVRQDAEFIMRRFHEGLEKLQDSGAFDDILNKVLDAYR